MKTNYTSAWLVMALLAFALGTGCGSSNSSLMSIIVSPGNMSVDSGTSLQYTATGQYTDDTTADLTSSVTWSSSNTLASVISNTTGSQGHVDAIAAGTTTILASDPTTSIFGSTTLKVL